jgi:flavodoxin
MNTAVAYFSRTGNTKKVAEAIASAARCSAQAISEYDAGKPVDVLFIGGSIYGGKLEPSLEEFIRSLSPGRVGKAVVFSTHVSGDKANALVRAALSTQNIPVAEECYSCKGVFLLFNMGHPNGAELEDAGKFAASMIKGNSSTR